MLDSLRKLFRERDQEGTGPSGGTAEPELRLAAAALLFEVVRADAQVKDEERTVMRTALQSIFGIDAEEAGRLVLAAEAASRGVASIYELTQVVDRELGPEQKKRLVELLWLVAFADTQKTADEEHMVRKISALLHVPHPDFIDAKLRARAASGIDGE
jgi:uncharacterized tellurite resistance protein B-like protein